jgi:gamma-glutamyl:cysteine ligase YbdK (ATP-grasp superfamily)
MTLKKKYRLAEVTGIELQYMVVDKSTLAVRPIVGQLFTDMVGQVTSNVQRGDVDLSNEIVSHIVELKTAKPTRNIARFRKKFHTEVKAINAILEKHGCMLLPTGMHPFMDPSTESVLWPHDRADVYGLYDTIFDRRQHGWSNVQCMHLNLPFANDDEFAKLHAAVRVLLPILPALSAASPILEDRVGGSLDMRMEHYLKHQRKVPELMGQLIPEAVFSQEDYYREVFAPIAKALAPHDAQGILDHHFANSRGASARFDRGSIEIRVIDAQECPGADLAIAELVTTVLKGLCNGKWMSSYVQRAWHESDLLAIFKDAMVKAGRASINNVEYLRTFGVEGDMASMNSIWRKLFEDVRSELSASCQEHIALILEKGCLAQRIVARTGKHPDRSKLLEVYGELAQCLADDRAFE